MGGLISRERIVELLRQNDLGRYAVDIADVLLAAPGIAVVELPEPITNERGTYFSGGGYGCAAQPAQPELPHGLVRAGIGPYMSPQAARAAAAALLAAANAAEPVA